jgi:hypothetical protein
MYRIDLYEREKKEKKKNSLYLEKEKAKKQPKESFVESGI